MLKLQSRPDNIYQDFFAGIAITDALYKALDNGLFITEQPVFISVDPSLNLDKNLVIGAFKRSKQYAPSSNAGKVYDTIAANQNLLSLLDLLLIWRVCNFTPSFELLGYTRTYLPLPFTLSLVDYRKRAYTDQQISDAIWNDTVTTPNEPKPDATGGITDYIKKNTNTPGESPQPQSPANSRNNFRIVWGLILAAIIFLSRKN